MDNLYGASLTLPALSFVFLQQPDGTDRVQGKGDQSQQHACRYDHEGRAPADADLKQLPATTIDDRSIIAALGTDEIPRIKIGVGVPPPEAGEQEIINWVLGGFAGKDADIIAETCEKACDALPVLIGEGAEKAMNKFN